MAHIHSATALVANTVTTVTLDEPYEQITVINRCTTTATTNEIWFTVDSTTPTVGGDNCYLCAGVPGESVTVPNDTGIDQNATGAITGSTINLISSGTPGFTIEGI